MTALVLNLHTEIFLVTSFFPAPGNACHRRASPRWAMPAPVLLLLPVLSMLPVPALATHYYVAPDGTGLGTDRDHPGDVNVTIRAICDGSSTQIASGDTVIFLDGTYLTSRMDLPLEADDVQGGRSGNGIALLNRHCGAPDYVRLMAETRRRATIQNDVTSNDTSGGFDIRRSSYIWIEGFRIIGSGNPAVLWEGGVKFSHGSHHVVARDNYIEGVGGAGVGAGGATHVRFEVNEIRRVAGSHPFCASGISLYRLENGSGFPDDVDGYANHVVGNRVFGTRSREGCDADTDQTNGIQSSDGNCIILDLFNDTGYPNRTLVANNLCVDNGGAGIHVFNSSHVDVLNNTLYANGAVHPLAELSVSCTHSSALTSVRFINNLVWPTRTAPVVATNWDGECVLGEIQHAHNIFVGEPPSTTNFVGVDPMPIATEQGAMRDCGIVNLVEVRGADAGIRRLDMDPDKADFSIGETSIAIDAGIGSPARAAAKREGAATACGALSLPEALSTDNAGLPRVVNGRPDVGAFEYQGTR